MIKWWRRKRGEPKMIRGNGIVVREAITRAQDDLREAIERRPTVDRLAIEVRRALGGAPR